MFLRVNIDVHAFEGEVEDGQGISAVGDELFVGLLNGFAENAAFDGATVDGQPLLGAIRIGEAGLADDPGHGEAVVGDMEGHKLVFEGRA